MKLSHFILIFLIAVNAFSQTNLEQAENVEKRYFDTTIPRTVNTQNYREADRRANEIIDNFIIKYDPDYVPPAYPGENNE